MYLGDRAVDALVTMHWFGITFSPKLRLLTSAKGAKLLDVNERPGRDGDRGDWADFDTKW
ncbi:MAG: hypothetical protein ACREJ3_14935 [Polyangiaceae bacterium]